MAAAVSLLLSLALVESAWATLQVADEIVYEGKAYPFRTEKIDTWPLDDYLDKVGRPRVFSSEGTQQSANWRGYVAKWEIREGSLLLNDILKLYGDPKLDSSTWEWRHVSLDMILQNQSYPTLALWYSGSLSIPAGGLVGCFPFEHPSEEIQIRIEGGKVVKTERIKIVKTEDAKACN
jgi:hypothetical protein